MRTHPRYKRLSQRRREQQQRKQRSRIILRRLSWLLILLIAIAIPVVAQIIALDKEVRARFEGNRWALPARVYASPLELHPGKALSARDFERELRALNYRKVTSVDEPGQYRRRGSTFYLYSRPFQFWDGREAGRNLRVRFEREGQVQQVTDLAAGKNLPLIRMNPRLIGKIYPRHKEDRTLITLSQVPPHLISALLTMEDRAFYEHYGISIRGMARAFMQNLISGRVKQGGSTITQQLVKNLFLSPERTITRKLKEAMMAVLLDWHYEKEAILEAYLNEVYFGQDGKYGIHGIGTAAWFYFAKPVERLDLAESALLVGMLKAASQYNPHNHTPEALERRALVLEKMRQLGHITPTEYEAAVNAPLDISEQHLNDSPYPAFLDVVWHQLRRDYREEDLRSAGLQIFTTLDPIVQNLAENALIRQARKLERSSKARKLNGALIVTTTENAEVLAVVGGRNPRYDGFNRGFNRALNTERPIGSLVKPAIYLAALEDSRRFSLLSTLEDKPFEWKDKDTAEIWAPKNYDGRLHGEVPLIKALTYSYNLATVHLGFEVGLEKVRDAIYRMGVERKFRAYPSMLLGGTSMTPLDVTQMYQTIANDGFSVPLRAIREVLTHDDQPLRRYSLTGEQHFDPAPVFLLNYALREVLKSGTGRRTAVEILPEDWILAGKTGTSNDLRDSWFAGFGKDMLAVAWLGRDDNKPIHLTGGDGAMKVWAEAMKNLNVQSLESLPPPRVKWRWVRWLKNNRWTHSQRGKNGAMPLPFIVSGGHVLTDSQESVSKPLYAFNGLLSTDGHR